MRSPWSTEAVFRRGAPVRVALVATGLVVLVLLAAGRAQAAACTASGPLGGSYTATICISAPAAGATVSGNTQITITTSVTAGGPGVQKVVASLGGGYLLTDFQAPYTFTLQTARYVDGARSLEVRAIMRDGFTTDASSETLTFANGITTPPVNTRSFTPRQGSPAPPGQPLTLAAAGDGAGGEQSERDVVGLIKSWNPNLFLYLGDVYEKGTAAEFYNWYRTSGFYGDLDAITNPTIGNHEYTAGDASGYFDYWDNAPHYYSVDAGPWHLVSLDSTSQFGETSPGSPQYVWLQNDLAATTQRCTLVYFHHPFFNTGQEGSTASLAPIWNVLAQNQVALVVTGHDHTYQRWVPLDGAGNASPTGITELVVGSGGHASGSFVTTDNRVASAIENQFGAVRLTLNTNGAGYQFMTPQGALLDSGSVQCRGTTDTTPPSAPTNLTATSSSKTLVNLSWDASVDGVGVTGYRVFRNGVQIAITGPLTKYADETVSASASYTYRIQGVDAAGNTSALSAPVSVTTPSQGFLFHDGFETGDLSAWSSVVSLGVAQDEVLSGAWAARSTSTGLPAYAVKQLSSDRTDLFAVTSFKILGQGANSIYLLRLRTPTGTPIATLFVSSTGKVGYRNDGAATQTTSSTGAAQGVWHTAEMHLRLNGASSLVEVWLDGTKIDALTKTESFSATSIGQLELGDNSSGRTFDIAYDEAAYDPAFITDTLAPSAPGALHATLATSGEVDLAWSPSVDNIGVTGYDVYRDGALVASLGPVSSYADTAVSPQTSYSYYVQARDAVGNISPASNLLPVTTPSFDSSPPSAPGDLGATVVGPTRVDLFWTASTDDTGVHVYRVFRDGTLIGTTPGDTTSYSDTTAVGSSTYVYTVTAVDPSGNVSDPSNPAAATTSHEVAFVDDFESGDLSKWTTNAGLLAQQQVVDNGAWAARGTSAGTATQALAQLASPRPNLYLRMRFDMISQGANSVTLMKFRTATNDPIAGIFLNNTGRIGVRNDVLGTSTTSTAVVGPGWHTLQFHAFVNGSGSGTGVWLDGAPVSGLQLATDLGTGQIGRLQLGENAAGRTYDVAFDGLVLDTQFVDDTIPPSTPTGLTATPASSGHRIDLSWAASSDEEGVAGYTVYRDGIAIATTASPSFADTGLQDATTYRYLVAAFDVSGNISGFSAEASAITPDVSAPDPPTGLTATPVPNRVDLTWTAPADNVAVTGYRIFRDGSQIGTVGVTTSYSDLSIVGSHTYAYRVAAVDAAGNVSAQSAPTSVTTLDTTPPSAPTGLTATASSTTRIDLAWTAATDDVGVTGYRIFRGGSQIGTVGATTTYADTSLSPGTTAAYTVRAVDAAGNISPSSAQASATTPLFLDGFETGNLSQWTTSSGLTVQSALRFAGTWAARGTTASSPEFATKQLAATQNNLYLSARVYIASLGKKFGTLDLMRFRTAAGASLLAIQVVSPQKLAYRNDVRGATVQSSANLSSGAWHLLRMHLVVSGTSSQVEVWLDGVRQATLSRTDSFGTIPIGRIEIGESASGVTHDVAYDDVALTLVP